MKSKSSSKQPQISQELPTQEIKPLNLLSLNVLGESDPSNITKQDLLSAISFDKQGTMLSVGDRGGRVIVFQRIEEGGAVDYEYMTEFQSHETAFDPLNSNQIPEKVNVIEWINQHTSSIPQLLSANDKLIKLWRLEYKKEKKYESCKKLLQKGKLMIPRSKVINESWEGRCKSLYKSAHEYHINSLCISPDGENFLSADDLRINLWNVENSTTVYNVLDMKPKSIDDLDEVISHCEFHPTMPSVFLYTTTKGFLHVCDFRETSNFQNHSTMKYDVGLGQKKNAFSEMINSLSFGKFLKMYPNHIVTRDYLSVKIWDIRQNQQQAVGSSKQTSVYQQAQVCDYLDKNLVNLYEEDSIYDKFFMDVSPCNGYMLTGGYNKSGHIIDLGLQHNNTLEAKFEMKRGKQAGKLRKYQANKKLPALDGQGSIDFKKKIMNGSWHPKENTVALAFRNCIFMYSERA